MKKISKLKNSYIYKKIKDVNVFRNFTKISKLDYLWQEKKTWLVKLYFKEKFNQAECVVTLNLLKPRTDY